MGRGSLFGPVSVGGVLFPARIIDTISQLPWYNQVKDSKQLAEIKRRELVPKIEEFFVTGVSHVSSRYIDRFNINLAIEKALYRLVQKFKIYLNQQKNSPRIQIIFLDGNYRFKSLDWTNDKNTMPPIKNVIKGDQRLFTIACASILAKVCRDNLLCRVSENYPEYHLDKNKGYGTKKHRSAILEHSITKHHRISFLKNLNIG